jgi:RNA polymerase sigma factor (sigma-70 family)
MMDAEKEKELEDLLAKAKDGDNGALGDLLQGMEGELLRHARRWTHLDQSGWELIQETNVRVVKKFCLSFSGTTVREFRGWLMRIFERTALTKMGKVKRRDRRAHHIPLRGEIEEDRTSVTTMLEEQLEREQWEREFHKLPPSAREVIELRLEGNTFAQIACILERNTEEVRYEYRSTLKKVRAVIEGEI